LKSVDKTKAFVEENFAGNQRKRNGENEEEEVMAATIAQRR
jgi:hypothetical protein